MDSISEQGIRSENVLNKKEHMFVRIESIVETKPAIHIVIYQFTFFLYDTIVSLSLAGILFLQELHTRMYSPSHP